MGQTIRVSLSGNNALTDTNMDHYALYADADNVLIKEKTRGTVSIAGFATATISHGLSYVPFFAVYMPSGSYYVWFYGSFYGSAWGRCYATTSNVYIYNGTSSTITARYYIFYDQQV